MNDTTQDDGGGPSANLGGNEPQLCEEIEQKDPSSTEKSNQFELTECPAYGTV